MTQDKMNPRDVAMANELERLAQSIQPNPAFQAELEEKLKAAHRPKRTFPIPMKNILPALGWTVALASLAFLLNWGIRNLAPLPPQPATGATPTPQTQKLPPPDSSTYNWNGITLTLTAPLPDLPTDLPLYQAQPDQHATLESARALATQFGMNGQIYLTPPEIPGAGDNDFLIVDGNQRLQVRSNQYFTYYPDYTRLSSFLNSLDDPGAEKIVADFLVAKGFGTQFRIEPTDVAGVYVAKPLLNGYPIQFEYFSNAALTFRFDKDGLFSVESSLVLHSPVDDKTYRIISAEEAFQKLLDPYTSAGLTLGQSSPYTPLNAWTRPRRENETVTVWGWMNSYPASEGGAPLVSLDGYTATGNIADVPADMPNTFVEATGQFLSTNSGAKVFNVDSWKIYDGYEDGIIGALQRDGDHVVIVTEDGTYILPDVPADVPLPMENAYVTGVKQGYVFEWKTLDNRSSMGSGGGGGGGTGFYKLNLSGTPAPFPTASPAVPLGGSEAGYSYVVVAGDTCRSIAYAFNVDVESLIAVNGLAPDCSNLTLDQVIIIPFTTPMPTERFDRQRGILSITIYEQADGGQRVVYGFITNNVDYPYLTLQGDNLESLQSNNGRPVDVWGTISYDSSIGVASLNVERFEIPFPDLKFQIIKGVEASLQLEGQTVLLFTAEDGRQYVELAPNCYDIIGAETVAGTGRENEPILLEAFALPNETFGGYPVLCVSSSAPAINPENNQPMELTITADQPSILPESPSVEAGTMPTLTIEKVELVYYMPNQRYLSAPSLGPVYLQPVWRFYGHYSDGSIFEALVQALDPIFLLPETEEPYSPG